MTRGTLFFIEETKNKKIRVTSTCEFNGDMYPEGHGKEVMQLLKKSTDVKSFKENVREFDKGTFNYQDEPGDYFRFYTEFAKDKVDARVKVQGNLIWVKFADDYFKNFFSDWTFWKNNTPNCEVQLFTMSRSNRGGYYSDGKIIKLQPGQSVAVTFGHYEEHYR